jgi:cysteine desulfurase
MTAGGTTVAGRVYLDHNASSPLRPEAIQAVHAAIEVGTGNPSSLHAEGRRARAAIERAREQVAGLVGADAGRIVFTSGGSEALASAVRGVCDRAPAYVRRIVVSQVEHSAVLHACRAMARQGFTVEEVPCDPDGRVDPDRFRSALKRHTALAALQWANNETGVLQPVDEVGRACRAAQVPFLVDAVQVAGKASIDPRSVPADFFAYSAHKVGGPQGAGALIVRRGIVLAPLIHGGAQEMRRRGGTPGVPAIAGFGAAAEAATRNLKEETARMLRLRARIETRIRDVCPDVMFHGQAAPRLPNTINFAVPGVPGDLLAIALDVAGFAVSTGSACASGAVEPSHVLLAMGLDETRARGAVRVSLGWNTTSDDADRFAAALPDVVSRVRGELTG